MSIKVSRWIIISAFIPSLAAAMCAPEKWAERFELELKCDMKISEVQALVRNKINAHEVPRFWETHVVQGARTRIGLGFEDGRLKFVQISWSVQMTRMASFQRIDLCGTAPPSPDVVHRLVPRK